LVDREAGSNQLKVTTQGTSDTLYLLAVRDKADRQIGSP
jgi:hypothetical protein